jgi:hypothetical protein
MKRKFDCGPEKSSEREHDKILDVSRLGCLQGALFIALELPLKERTRQLN